MTVPSYLAFTVISVLSLALAVSSLTLAQDPTREPPLDNVSPPLNTSSSSQVKAGGLGVGSLVVGGSEGVVIDGANHEIRFTTTATSSGLDSRKIKSISLGDIFSLSFDEKTWRTDSPYPRLITYSSNFHSSGMTTQGKEISETYSYGSYAYLDARNRDAALHLRRWIDGGDYSDDIIDPTSKISLSTYGLNHKGPNPFEIFSKGERTGGFSVILENEILDELRNEVSDKLENGLLDEAGFLASQIRLLPVQTRFHILRSATHSLFSMSSLKYAGQNNYDVRLGINTKDPRYPLDVVVSSTTTEPWVAGFGYDSLVKIAADGRVAANQYCDSAGNNCLNPSDLETTIQNLQNRLESLENGG